MMIITEPYAFVADVHDRMRVILDSRKLAPTVTRTLKRNCGGRGAIACAATANRSW